MDNSKEIQQQEIEALESIYATDLNVISSDYPNISVQVAISPDSLPYLKQDKRIEGIALQATLPADYPNVAPELKCISKENDDYFVELFEVAEKELKIVANDNLGMSMIFSLVAALQDIITREIENRSAKVEKIEQEKKAIADRLEQVHFEGSRVTVEQFNEWRDKFMEELRAKKEVELKEKELLAGRLTGKQLFLCDDSLNLSDLQIINCADTCGGVEIDATLFEDDIDDEDLSDNNESS